MKFKFLFFAAVIEILIIVSITLANEFSKINENLYPVFYNGIYGLCISTLIPILYIKKYKDNISTLGVKKIKFKQLLIIIVFVVASIGGQSFKIQINTLDLNLLKICILPLIMTTFFEEFMFRGFMQTRFEKYFGWIIAIILSGFIFSIYHLGYPGFRNLSDLLLLFIVGIGFAVAYKISGNNVIVSFFVNLPNAILTYLIKSKQFPQFYKNTSTFAFFTIIIVVSILVLFAMFQKRIKK
jgi:membrane protease YdiL (CAAX protease family)